MMMGQHQHRGGGIETGMTGGSEASQPGTDDAKNEVDVKVPTLVQNFWTYLQAPMVYDYWTPQELRGRKVPSPRVAWAIHLLKAVISEGFFRMTLSAVYALIGANVLVGNVSFLMGAVVKAGVFAALLAALGYHGAFGRAENLLVSWFPSSDRAFSPYKHVVPYADLWHTLVLLITQYVFSLVGVSLALWVTNFVTINASLPNTLFEAFGVVGAYSATTSDVWLAEFGGSAFITFLWLMTVVDFHGLRNRTEVAIVMFFGIAGISGVLYPITGANFDSIHFLAMKTILLGGGNEFNNGRASGAYIVAPILGAALALIGWLILSLLEWQTLGANPGIANSTAIEERQLELQNLQDRSIFPKSPFKKSEYSYRHLMATAATNSATMPTIGVPARTTPVITTLPTWHRSRYGHKD